MERAIKEKMSVYQEMSTAMPHDLVNAKAGHGGHPRILSEARKLRQFMDQTTPLSEITQARFRLLTGWSFARARGFSKSATFTPRTTPHLSD